MIVRRWLAVSAAAAVILGGTATAYAGQTTNPDKVQLHLQGVSSDTQLDSTVFLTGVVAASGSGEFTSPQSPHQQIYVLTLGKGTISINTTGLLDTIYPDDGPPWGNIDTTTCSVWGSASSPVTIVGGTGTYAGIAGSGHATETLSELFPDAPGTGCNTSGPATGNVMNITANLKIHLPK
jgi:hypothetical protein